MITVKRMVGGFGRRLPRDNRWYGDSDGAVLVSRDEGRILGYYEHDGDGKYEHVVYVRPLRALRIILTSPAWITGFAPFPFCSVELVRSRSFEDAQVIIEDLAG